MNKTRSSAIVIENFRQGFTKVTALGKLIKPTVRLIAIAFDLVTRKILA